MILYNAGPWGSFELTGTDVGLLETTTFTPTGFRIESQGDVFKWTTGTSVNLSISFAQLLPGPVWGLWTYLHVNGVHWTSTQPVGLTITGNSTISMSDFVIKRSGFADTVMANGALIYR